MNKNEFSEIDEIIRQSCKPAQVCEPPITLMEAKDRWTIDRLSPDGFHNRGVAMWARPFDGGVTLAQHILDHKDDFKGKNVVDIGSGSGLVAIAAALCGAKVTAVDSDPYAARAIFLNAAKNGVTLGVFKGNAITPRIPYAEADLVTASDVFYINRDRDRLVSLLSDLARDHKTIYATSQDEKLPALFAPHGVTPKVISNGVTSFVTFDASDCGAPQSPRAKIPLRFSLIKSFLNEG